MDLLKILEEVVHPALGEKNIVADEPSSFAVISKRRPFSNVKYSVNP